MLVICSSGMGLLIQGGNINHAAKVENGNAEMGLQAVRVIMRLTMVPQETLRANNSFGNTTLWF